VLVVQSRGTVMCLLGEGLEADNLC
jgi:hypothetical protein